MAATTASALGDHAEAVRQLTLVIESRITIISGNLQASTEAAEQLAECFVSRAKSQQEIGDLKAAVSDCSNAIQLFADSLSNEATTAETDSSGLEMKMSALTIRGHAHEQLERYTESAADLEEVVRLSTAGGISTGLAVVALARVQRAAKAAAALAAANGPKIDSWMSVPRPGLRRFENRGKAGKAF